MYTCRGALPADARAEVTALLAAGQEAEARARDAAARRPCGASLDAVCAAIPEDGAEHEGTCPACGLTFVVRRVAAAPTPAGDG